MAAKVKMQVKVAGALILGAGLYFGINTAVNHGWIPSNLAKSSKIGSVHLRDVQDAEKADVKLLPLPSTTPAVVKSTPIIFDVWEWNAQSALLLANGGPHTTKGSLMEKGGVNLTIQRQDNNSKMIADLIGCAKQEAKGATSCGTGANAIIVMGDGSPQFLATMNPQLAKLGPQWTAKVIGSVGYSRGEDACMAPPSLKDPKSIATTPMLDSNGNPLAATGLLVDAVVRDGDYNICAKWAGDNDIPLNPDETTFDKNAINWVNAPDYNTAAADYVGGNKCQDRKEVTNGKPTGKTVHVCVNGVATWTPGDVTVAKGRGGLIKIADSAKYRSQMPAVIIGPSKFFQDNRDEIKQLLYAAFTEADQLKEYDSAVRAASRVSATIYADQGGKDDHGKDYTDGEYWYHYFHPVLTRDAQGLPISLGGSAVNNYADNKILFGIDGTNDNFASTYTVFANIDQEQYPNLFKPGGTPIPDVKTIEDKSYLRDLADLSDSGQAGAADTVDYSKVNTGQVVSNKAVYISFATGSAALTPAGEATLKALKDDLVSSDGLRLEVSGYTDNTGSAEVNRTLSQARAETVANYLKTKGNFPSSRFSGVQGYGPDNPICPANDTPVCKAKNRRVDITQIN